MAVWQAAKRVPTEARSVWDVYASFFNVQTDVCVCALGLCRHLFFWMRGASAKRLLKWLCYSAAARELNTRPYRRTFVCLRLYVCLFVYFCVYVYVCSKCAVKDPNFPVT